MKYIVKSVLLVFAVVVYSCHFDSKKHVIDTIVKANLATNRTPSDETTGKNELNISTNVVFPGFKIILHGFKAYDESTDPPELGYNGDATDVKIEIDKSKTWNLIPKKDTLYLRIADFKAYYSDPIEFIPENKTDVFKVSYAFNVIISRPNATTSDENLTSMTTYKLLKESSNYFFNIPESLYTDYWKPSENEIKKKLKLKDTMFQYNDDYEGIHALLTEHGVVYKNKACRINADSRIYLKIERYNGTKLIDTKFLVIYADDEE